METAIVLPETDEERASDAGEAVPYASWFDKSVFSDENFDAATYVDELGEYVELADLRANLERYDAEVEEKLQEIVDEDFDAFLKLSEDLVDVEAVTRGWDEPLLKLESEIGATRAEALSALEEMNDLLERKRETAERRATLELMLDANNVVSKADLESLVPRLASSAAPSALELAAEDAGTSSGGGGGGATTTSAIAAESCARARLLDRVASEVNRLRYYREKGKDLLFIRNLEPRIDAAEDTLASAVRDALSNATMTTRSKDALRHCLSAYCALGRVANAEEILRVERVAPAIKKVVDAQLAAASTSSGGTARARAQASSTSAYASLVDACARAALKACDLELEITRDVDGGDAELASEYDLLANCVLREVDGAVAAAKPAAYSPGAPDAFLANHLAAMAMIESLERQMPNVEALRRFRDSDAMSTFLKRWNLNAYYALRFQSIAGAVEEAASATGPLALAVRGNAGGFATAVAAAHWDGVERCWSEEVFLPLCADKFTKLTCDILNRYDAWLIQGLNGEKTEEPPDASATAADDDLLAVRADAEKLVALCSTTLYQKMRDVLTKSHGEEFAGMAIEIVAQSVDHLNAGGAEALTRRLVGAVVDACGDALKQLKGITATFRMTNKPTPTRHSHFVPNILAPARTFLESPSTTSLSKQTRRALACAVADGVCAKYSALASELLATVKKTEASLNKLKDRKAAAAKEGAGASASATTTKAGSAQQGPTDAEKIVAQVTLDVREFGAQLAAMGVDPASRDAFKELWAVAAPEGATF
ncbi:uncharacterized protein MICPUCDRAFT_21533 [Micromonas pusilla CCMP1545]|uniref:Conserved oligomeric Golgi complex subunit 2 n=1 Tax=Micromonas pusilla (strain CCMP1545) TaxID=564608 RepID=C1N3K6_MICPC|nr:uncharacterized protein MICPUCDRAFT_21533 [Micromonas pusilla CCMP1545]EEH53449.1 predicted protein [Micromonas pusilla CCMP1545]|eukprot:XP_003062630.1 predicted protein [Micromonas pusilla CCMP1545]